MKEFDNSRQNGDGGRKRKSEICSLDTKGKRLKTNYRNIASLSPEKMSAVELCVALEESEVDIEDIRGLLVYRLKRAIRDEMEK